MTILVWPDSRPTLLPRTAQSDHHLVSPCLWPDPFLTRSTCLHPSLTRIPEWCWVSVTCGGWFCTTVELGFRKIFASLWVSHPTVVSEPVFTGTGKFTVGKQNSAKELWDRLEELFAETSLPSIKLTGDKNIDDYTPIVLLNATPEAYSDVKAAVKYGRDNVSLGGRERVSLIMRYVPDLNHNLMSCAALEEEGLEGRRGKGIMKIMKGSLTVFKADRRRNLYDISLKGLELLQKEGVLIDKIEKLKFCDECVMGKQHKVQFPASQTPNPSSSSGILDYVHADVWGPSNTPTHGGKWKVLVENQTGKKLKALRTDNGLEFCNQNFSDLCDECVLKDTRLTLIPLNRMVLLNA
ncbi:Retrovirus-related Pol polyprotein from transposon TNT 1-94 [Sesamum angolense]|uniref:Retrovirus-related Pol polyprotein from transposon TNT 1-94 n=1 Tax=Sesamum angolense TaxID=2727404 RepID=A0AAE1W162_9LAMI|nr:Retrovirus-related Pol polyprotein from transposon TNT 1-94 [Sesamum angolense]